MRIKLLLMVLALTSLNAASASETPVEEGKAIFMSRCASCHNVNKILLGPALAGIEERRSIDWIISFVHSSQSMVRKGDKDAVALFEKFKIQMPDHADLTGENIKNIVEFIKSESNNVSIKNNPVDKQTVTSSNAFPVSFSTNLWPTLGLLISSLLLIATSLFALRVKYMKKLATAKKVI